MSTTQRDVTSVGSGGEARLDSSELEAEPSWVRPTTRRQSVEQSVKRWFDVGSAAMFLLVASPLMAVIACAVSVSSEGGPLFIQDRVGRGSKTFRLYKFRTMRQGTFEEVMSDPGLRAEYEANNFKLANNDNHITSIGKWLRKASLDELPQLWNVLKGDMSMVGIRPLVSAELAQRPPVDQMLYRSARPGLTGLWQVGGRSDIVGSDRLALDRDYIEGWSLLADLKILLRTPVAIIRVDRAT